MKKIVFVTVVIFLLPGVIFSQSVRKKVAEGNKLFTEEKFDEANNKYRDALIDQPESAEIHFNIGNTQYKKKKYEEAFAEFEKSLSTEDIMLQSKAYYNMGNNFYRMGKLPESILAYTQALKYNPDDVDAKYNLEYVRRKMKDEAQKQQSDNQQQQQQQQQNQQQQQENQNQDEQREQQEQQEQQQQTADQEQDQQEQQQQQRADEEKMSKEDAERILDALKNDEKDLQKDRKVKSSGSVRVLKDW